MIDSQPLYQRALGNAWNSLSPQIRQLHSVVAESSFSGECLRYVIRHWTLFGIPLPLSIGPRGTAVESVEDGKFRFEVELGHILAGLIVRYQGTLSPDPVQSATFVAPFSP